MISTKSLGYTELNPTETCFKANPKMTRSSKIYAARHMSNNRIANDASKMSDIHENEVTSVICRNIKPGHEKDYDNWLKRYLALQKSAPGYRSITIIIPGEGKPSYRYIIRKFDNKADMERWDNSKESLKLIDEANKYSTQALRDINRFGNLVYTSRLENP